MFREINEMMPSLISMKDYKRLKQKRILFLEDFIAFLSKKRILPEDTLVTDDQMEIDTNTINKIQNKTRKR